MTQSPPATTVPHPAGLLVIIVAPLLWLRCLQICWLAASLAPGPLRNLLLFMQYLCSLGKFPNAMPTSEPHDIAAEYALIANQACAGCPAA